MRMRMISIHVFTSHQEWESEYVKYQNILSYINKYIAK